jgi:hypothetical protein
MNAEGPGRSYRATGAFNLSFFLSGAFNGSGISGCAGAQPQLSDPRNAGEMAFWVGFKAIIAVGWT